MATAAFSPTTVEPPPPGTPCQQWSTLRAGIGAEEAVRRLTDFKRRLDRALGYKATIDDKAWRRKHGFMKSPAGTGVGWEYADWVFGGFVCATGDRLALCKVPAWMCIGWNREQRPSLGYEDAREVAGILASATMDGRAERATGDWFEPLPLVLMGEGKNRIDLHSEHVLEVGLLLRKVEMPDPRSLLLRRVVGTKDLVWLECSDPYFTQRRPKRALLPFPELAVPLLELYGVKWGRLSRPLTPWNPLLRYAHLPPHNDSTQPRDRWRPSKWRQMFLSQKYV